MVILGHMDEPSGQTTEGPAQHLDTVALELNGKGIGSANNVHISFEHSTPHKPMSPLDLAVANKAIVEFETHLLRVQLDGTEKLDDLERKYRIATGSAEPVDLLSPEQRAKVHQHLAIMNAAGFPVTEDDVNVLMRPQLPTTSPHEHAQDIFRRLGAYARACGESLRKLAPVLEETPEQRERRQARNKRKAARRRGKR